jgi:hypothetical protein
MTEKIDLKKLYHESKKERTEKQTKEMERALEGVVYGFPRNTADDPILKITMSQENTNG